MAYTVKQVAEISQVSVRTLHFYDEVGLLNPAYVGDNGYRFYEEPQLLTLQQILFYRELGLELKQIREILGRADFEKVAALQSHRKLLERKLTRTGALIQTIDKTIAHLKGTRQMSTEEMFAGFTVAAGDDRFGEHIILGGPNGDPIDCKVSGKDTNGALCVFELTINGGGPKHLHYDLDEWIYILDGEFEFHVGAKQLQLGRGESIFIPRNVAHVWGSASETRGRIVNVYQPAGSIEEFFREVGTYSGEPPIHEALGVEGLHKLFTAHRMSLLGPPLGWKQSGSR
jgi:DNA-binding transcriptional MerR regulator/quercetin dioxygenase-like cupin family protein